MLKLTDDEAAMFDEAAQLLQADPPGAGERRAMLVAGLLADPPSAARDDMVRALMGWAIGADAPVLRH